VDPVPLSPLEKAVQSVKECFAPAKLQKGIDTALAGLGLFGSLALMSVLEPIVGVKLFAAPMMASGIIFFSPPSPPNPFGFLVGTTGSGKLPGSYACCDPPQLLRSGVGASNGQITSLARSLASDLGIYVH
jgi:hypothetical protein